MAGRADIEAVECKTVSWYSNAIGMLPISSFAGVLDEFSTVSNVAEVPKFDDKTVNALVNYG